jgi:hypothetical protein
MTYEDIYRKYQRISYKNTMRARKVDTAEAYEKAQSRERLIQKALFADCRRYLDGDLKPKEVL